MENKKEMIIKHKLSVKRILLFVLTIVIFCAITGTPLLIRYLSAAKAAERFIRAVYTLDKDVYMSQLHPSIAKEKDLGSAWANEIRSMVRDCESTYIEFTDRDGLSEAELSSLRRYKIDAKLFAKVRVHIRYYGYDGTEASEYILLCKYNGKWYVAY